MTTSDYTAAVSEIPPRARTLSLDALMTLEPVPDDAAIRRSLQASLNKSAWAPAGLTFTVTDGSIHLYGSIGDARYRLAVQVVAENIRGVTMVTDCMVDANPPAAFGLGL